MDAAFEVHMLNDQGKKKAQQIAIGFDDLLRKLRDLANDAEGHGPAAREFAIVRTKLEEACFFAKKAMASIPENQA